MGRTYENLRLTAHSMNFIDKLFALGAMMMNNKEINPIINLLTKHYGIILGIIFSFLIAWYSISELKEKDVLFTKGMIGVYSLFILLNAIYIFRGLIA